MKYLIEYEGNESGFIKLREGKEKETQQNDPDYTKIKRAPYKFQTL